MAAFDAGVNAGARVLHRVLCPKRRSAHTVGRVVATDGGPVLRIVNAVHGKDQREGDVLEFTRAHPDAGGMWEAYCAPCDLVLPFVPAELLAASGKASVLKAEGMWKDGVGVLRRAATRRAERA